MSPAVLVTGGSGFIGAWVLRELLEAGQRVVALDVRPATERWGRVIGSPETKRHPHASCSPSPNW